MPDINLNPYTAESAAIQRRLQMAQLLGQQALQPVDVPQQAGVRASPYMGLAKMLQGYMAGSEEKSALEAYKDLAERYQTGNVIKNALLLLKFVFLYHLRLLTSL